MTATFCWARPLAFTFSLKMVQIHASYSINVSSIFQVTDTHRLWGWMRQGFLPNIYSQPWYNGLKDEKDVYIENKMSILIGMPWMRQLRIRKSKHSLPWFLAFWGKCPIILEGGNLLADNWNPSSKHLRSILNPSKLWGRNVGEFS